MPGQDWQIDFTHMPRHRTYRYLLVLVDTFSGWVEAFPTAWEMAAAVVEVLTAHLIPRFGLPNSLQSDNGPAFISISQQVAAALGIDWHLHVPYRPQSSGKVERVNGIIKTHLTKLASELWLSWVDLLPLALTCIRTTPHSKTGLTPFELLYGRPYLLTHLPEGEAPPLAGYLPLFSLLRSLLREHADQVLPQPTDNEGPTGPLAPGDQVLLKTLSPCSLQPCWTGPHTVILTTPTAAKLLGHEPWYHLTRLKRAPPGLPETGVAPAPTPAPDHSYRSTLTGPTKLTITRIPLLPIPE